MCVQSPSDRKVKLFATALVARLNAAPSSFKNSQCWELKVSTERNQRGTGLRGHIKGTKKSSSVHLLSQMIGITETLVAEAPDFADIPLRLFRYGNNIPFGVGEHCLVLQLIRNAASVGHGTITVCLVFSSKEGTVAMATESRASCYLSACRGVGHYYPLGLTQLSNFNGVMAAGGRDDDVVPRVLRGRRKVNGYVATLYVSGACGVCVGGGTCS